MEHLRLFELNQLIRNSLDASLEPSYWVVAEIADLRLNQRGHCYLELVEKEDEKVVARMRATIWAYTYRGLSAWFEAQTGKPLQSGLTVLCNVNVQFHELFGLSVNIREIDPTYTLGERARKRQEIIDRLTGEGVFDMNRSLPLPVVPLRIAVISSPTAAGYGDFMNQIESNQWEYAFQIRLFKAVMQGDDAPESIMNALQQIHSSGKQFDLVAIIRGGGAQVDLDCFDTYHLANHVAQFPLPVLTGIGHERDETILDLVAHTRMKTPTALAEFIISGVKSYEERLVSLFQRIAYHSENRIKQEKQRIQQVQYRLTAAVNKITSRQEMKLEKQLGRLKHGLQKQLQLRAERISLAEKALELIHPDNILKRGYTMTTVNGKHIDKTNINSGDELVTFTVNKKIISIVNSVNNKQK